MQRPVKAQDVGNVEEYRKGLGKSKKSKIKGKGRWEDEYNREANRIPGVNQRLLAEIGTDLKHRLSELGTTRLTAPFLSLFGIETRKEALVREALATLRRLSDEFNQTVRPENIRVIQDDGEIWYFNRVTNRSTWEDPRGRTLEQLIAASRTTGPLGEAVVRENPPKYAPITSLEPEGIFDQNSEKFQRVINSPFPKEFKLINLNNFDPATPIPWGKFNTVFIEGNDGTVGHVGVLIRNLTDPISYTFYDSNAQSWRIRGTFFNPWRRILDGIVGDAEVNFNDSRHQCDSYLCKTFARIRATYPELTNEQYNVELIRTARAIASNPNFPISNTGFPIRERSPAGFRRAGFVTPPNIRQTLLTYTNEAPPGLPLQGQYGHQAGDVFAAPLVTQKVQQELLSNPQQAVPFSNIARLRAPAPAPAPAPAAAEPVDGQGKPKKCKKCGLSKLKGGAVPEDLRFLQQMTKQSYNLENPQEWINGWTLKRWTPTMKFWMKGKSVIVGVRGTKTTEDVMTWGTIPLNRLDTTGVYKRDKAELEQFQEQYLPSEYTYYAVGHSLGGAIIDNFIRAGLIKEAVTYNPAIQTKDINAGLPNRRIYYGNDPLYRLMGWWDRKSEHRKPEDKSWADFLYSFTAPGMASEALSAHNLKNFNFTGGVKRVKN